MTNFTDYRVYCCFITFLTTMSKGFAVKPRKNHHDIIIHTDSGEILMELPDHFKHLKKVKL